MNQILELLPPAGIALPPIAAGVVAVLFSFYLLWRRPLNVHVAVALLLGWVLPSLFPLETFEWLHQQHVWRVFSGGIYVPLLVRAISEIRAAKRKTAAA